MKKLTLYPQVLSLFLAVGIAPMLLSCDDSSKPEKAATETESKEAAELAETAEEAEGIEAAKEAIKKKDEQEEKESEGRKEKREEKKLGAESKPSPGLKRR